MGIYGKVGFKEVVCGSFYMFYKFYFKVFVIYKCLLEMYDIFKKLKKV